MTRVGKGLVVAGMLIGGAFAPVRAEPPVALPRETWMGIYMGGAKIGYMRTVVDHATFKGSPSYRLDSFMRSNVELLGVKLQQDVHTIIFTDESFSPLYEEFQMSSGGKTTRVVATFTDKSVECEVVSEGTMKKSIPIPEGADLISDTMFSLEGKKFKVGDIFRMHYFNPLTLTIDSLSSEIEREEELELHGEKHKSYVVQYKAPLADITCWQSPDGELLKVITVMGMTMLKENRQQALAQQEVPDIDYTPPSDFAVLTSVKADKDIQKPTEVRKMKIRLIGMKDRSLFINDKRQQATMVEDADPPAAEFTVTTAVFDPKLSTRIGKHPEETDQFTGESPYIQVRDKDIADKAAEIVGKSTSAYEAACKIRAWLNKTMQPQANIGVPRSAADVLKHPVGVCRDYATLYTALARAAGIPTKLVAGLVYMNGSFYYHAWAESYVGEWLPFDATLSTDVVDATHIKFTEGEATSMFLMSRVIGTLKAEILEVE